MPLPVFKDGIFAKGALAAGQTIRLGGFLMTACPATTSTMTSRVIESNLHVSSEFAEQLDPMELSSINELLDQVTTKPRGMTRMRTTSEWYVILS